MRLPLLLLISLAGNAAAQTPEDFAWQWPVVTRGQEGAYQLVLDEPAYARIARGDLRDLAAFNADGQPVPFAPLVESQPLSEQRSELRWLRIAAPAEGASESFSLRLERDADGRVRDLQLDTGTTAASTPSRDLLIDLGEDPPSVSSLRLTLGADAALPVNLRVDVLASDDLADWQTLASGLALVAMDDNGLRIERLQLDFGGSRQRYLRLSVAGDAQWPAIARIEDRRLETSDGQAWQNVSLMGRAVDGEPGVFEYRSPGPMPVGRVDLQLPSENTVAAARLESRDGDEAPWYPVVGFTAFRLGAGRNEVQHLPADVGIHRERQWRLHTEPALAQAPTLVLGYRPDRFVMLAQGAAPYRLLAGSVRTTRPDYPVQAALAAMRASNQPGWQLPVAMLGEGSAAPGGQAALSPDRGPQHRRWVLWAVLAIGVGLVLVVSLRVLRHPKSE
ncbi:MAG: DUF3999 family protein [Arenimonas sp.]|nr:DUF3999 family protein [Arenimonas sp.]